MKDTEFGNLTSSDYPVLAAVASAMRASMISRKFDRFQFSRVLRMCTILDPRFKNHPFPNAITINEAKHALYEAAAKVHPQEEETVAYEVKGSLFDDLGRAVCISKVTAHAQTASRNEVDNYLGEPTLGHQLDPLEWWKERRDRYPRLVVLVRRYLCMIMNSVPCERIFSKMGLVITDRRTNITAEKASLVGVLASNLKHLPTK
jgi:hypothetical protein